MFWCVQYEHMLSNLTYRKKIQSDVLLKITGTWKVNFPSQLYKYFKLDDYVDYVMAS